MKDLSFNVKLIVHIVSEYTIKEVSQITGIKAHTLRIWEKRYAFLNPGRTSSNFRYYNEEDVNLLLHVVELKKKGMRISEIAELSLEEIIAHVDDKKLPRPTDVSDNFIHSTYQMDSNSFERNFKNCVEKHGLDASMNEIIYPLINKVNVLFLSGSINKAQEDFFYQSLSYCLLGNIYGLSLSMNPRKPSFLIAATERYLQRVYAMHVHYLVKQAAYDVRGLHFHASLDQLDTIYHNIQPEYIFLSLHKEKLIDNNIERLQDYAQRFKSSTLLILSTPSIQGLHLAEKNIHFIRNMKEVKNFLKHLQ